MTAAPFHSRCLIKNGHFSPAHTWRGNLSFEGWARCGDRHSCVSLRPSSEGSGGADIDIQIWPRAFISQQMSRFAKSSRQTQQVERGWGSREADRRREANVQNKRMFCINLCPRCLAVTRVEHLAHWAERAGRQPVHSAQLFCPWPWFHSPEPFQRWSHCLICEHVEIQPTPPAQPTALSLHKWGYSHGGPVRRGVNLWTSLHKIGYQSQQACCFKLIPTHLPRPPGKRLLSESPEGPSNVFPSATWSTADRVVMRPHRSKPRLLNAINTQQGRANATFSRAARDPLEYHRAGVGGTGGTGTRPCYQSAECDTRTLSAPVKLKISYAVRWSKKKIKNKFQML